MKKTFKRLRVISVAGMFCIAMLFASMASTYAYADDTSLTLQGITKVSSFNDRNPALPGIQMVIPVTDAFVFIKQGTADKNTFYLWTREASTLADRQAILDYVIAQPGVSDDEATINNVNFISGFGSFLVTPKHGATYTYAFSENGAGQGVVISFGKDKISHYYYGQYDSGEFEPL